MFSSFLKKIAKQNKLDFYYFLLNFKLNTDLNLLNRSLANELLKLFNKELFTNEHISPILYKKSNKLIKHKRKYIEGTVHDAKIIDFNNEGGFIKISSEFRAFVPFEHLMKKDGSLLKKGEFAKFEVIEFNEKHQIFFMSHTYTFKKMI